MFATNSSRLSAVEKASLAGVDAAGKKPKRALNWFGSDLSVSDSEAVPSERPRKRPRESFVSKEAPKPPLTRGEFDYLFIFLRVLRTIMVDPFCFHLDDMVIPPPPCPLVVIRDQPRHEDLPMQKPSTDVA
jgi:hypothetical protein